MGRRIGFIRPQTARMRAFNRRTVPKDGAGRRPRAGLPPKISGISVETRRSAVCQGDDGTTTRKTATVSIVAPPAGRNLPINTPGINAKA